MNTFLTIAALVVGIPVGLVVSYFVGKGWVHIWDLMTEEQPRR